MSSFPSSTSTTIDNHAPPGDTVQQVELSEELSVSADDGACAENGPGHGKEQAQWIEPALTPILDPEADGMAGVLNRVLSRISTSTNIPPSPPPDGGREAWTICLCTHLVIFNTWGVINSFGVYQAYYATYLDRSPSEISWIGSLQVFLTFFVGAFTGRFTDAGFLRPIMILGSCIILIGAFMTSIASQYWHFILSQGLCMGIGNGFIFTPATSTLSTYFSKRRSLAIGIGTCGGVTGGLVFPSMARQLIPSIGLGWAIRAMGFVQLGTLAFVCIFMHSRVPPRRAGSVVDWVAFKDLDYTFYCLGMFFNFWGVYFAFYYAASFGRTSVAPTLSYTDSLNLLLLMNGIGCIGRLVPNHFADRWGVLNIMIPSSLAAATCQFAWMGVKTPAGLDVWASFYGIAGGALQALFPAGLSSLVADPQQRGTRMGMGFTIVSFSVLTGNPIGGAIVTACGGKYWGAQTFTGASLLIGMGFMIAAKASRQRRCKKSWDMKI